MTESSTQNTIDCERAHDLVRTFAGGSIPASKGRALRAHLVECPDCKAFYRETVEMAAHIGQGVRRDREQDEERAREDQREEDRQVALGTATPKKRDSRFALRMILVPAFFFFLMVWLTKFAAGGDRAFLVETQGQVWLGETLIEESDETKLKRGDWCTTGAMGRAELEVGSDAKLTLYGTTRVLVEDPKTRRFRFRSGDACAEGRQSLTTSFGIVDVADGRTRLSFIDGSFELKVEEGSATFADSTGTHELGPGETLVRGVQRQ